MKTGREEIRMMENLSIAIDGTSGSGKSTAAKNVAKALGIEYIDTGAMYRAAAYKALSCGVPVSDDEAVGEMLSGTEIDFVQGNIILDGENVNDKIRTLEISKAASQVSKLVSCRNKLVEIQRRIAEAARPGTPASELYAIAVHTAAEAGLSEYFMGHRQQAGFVGHGIGIEINEMPVLAPRSKEILAEGMVFALEPKFVIPGVGAVGIENSFAVTAGGLEKLTLLDEEIVPLA